MKVHHNIREGKIQYNVTFLSLSDSNAIVIGTLYTLNLYLYTTIPVTKKKIN